MNFRVLVTNSKYKTIAFAVLVFVFTLLFRLPYINYPGVIVGDEGVYTTFALNTLHGEPFFEIHPPLSRIVFAEISKPFHPSLQEPIRDTGKSFGDFPFIYTRLFNALLGSLLPVIVFLIAISLGVSSMLALIPALLVSIDGIFIQYSRLMLPDMLLWVFGFLGTLTVLVSKKYENKPERLILILLSSIFLGLAISVKWTALGFFLACGFYLVRSRRFKDLIILAFGAFVVYLLVWTFYFSFFPGGGKVDTKKSYYPTDYVSNTTFPQDFSASEIFSSVLSHHKSAWKVNNDPALMQATIRRGTPYLWPLGIAPYQMWFSSSEDTSAPKMMLVGNVDSFTLAFLAVLYAFFITVFHFFKKAPSLTEAEEFLLAGYILNYLPFLFIMFSRPMYIYHYGISLIFAFLLIPLMYSRFKIIFDNKKKILKFLNITVIVLIIIFFLLSSPLIYGF